MAEIARRGAAKRKETIGAERLKEIARKALEARWAKYREQKETEK